MDLNSKSGRIATLGQHTATKEPLRIYKILSKIVKLARTSFRLLPGTK